jgi:phospholipid transport system substrate-binding protein
MTQISGLSQRYMCRLPALAIAVAALVIGAHPAQAQDVTKSPGPLGPLGLVTSSVTRVFDIVQSQADGGQRRAEVRKLVETLFDFNEMSRRTLGQHWTERSPKEQEEFVRLFTDLLERAYLTTIGNHRLATVTFQGESVEGSWARVRSQLVTDRRMKIPIEYRMLENAGRWAVYDIVVEGVSIISNYRTQFNAIIRTSSFALLLDRLRFATRA